MTTTLLKLTYITYNNFNKIVPRAYFEAKRWAGHSKWANIKHTKMSKDLEKSALFSKIAKKIALAVKDGGENPETNSKLRAAIDEAKKVSMPNSSIQQALKKVSSAETKPYWLHFMGPSGLIMSFEVVSANSAHALGKLNQYGKKIGLKHERNVSDICNEKGIILTESLTITDSVYEKAVEDAIEAGAEEVVKYNDDVLLFECSPERLDGVTKKLQDIGYQINSSTCEVTYNNFIKLGKDQMDLIEKTIERINNNFDGLSRVNYNKEEA